MACFAKSFAVLALIFAPLLAFADDSTYRDALAAARHEVAAGDLNAAQARMKKAVAEFPRNPEVHLLLAVIDLKLGRSPEAEDEARLSRYYGGNDDETAPVQAQAMLQQNKLGGLIQQVAPGTRAPVAEAAVRRALALAHLGLGQTDSAEQLLNDAKRLDPGSTESDLYLARLLMVKGDYDGAEAMLQKVRAAQPDSIDVLRMEADLARSKGDTAGALAEYEKAMVAHPDDLGLLSGHATLLISLNRLDEAQKDVDAALDQAPFSLTPNFLAGLLDARQGKMREADERLVGVSGAFDALPNGYYVLGSVKYALGQYENAISNLAQFIARRPDNIEARRLLATAALKMADNGRVIDVLRPVVYQDPNDKATIGLLAQAYIGADRRDEAVDLLRWAATARPDDVRAKTDAAMLQLGLGNAYAGGAALEQIAASAQGVEIAGPLVVLNDLRNGHLAKASDMAEQLLKRSPDDAVVQELVGTVRLAQLRFPDAEQMFKTIIAKDPNFIAARRDLAQTYLAMNRPDDARAALTELNTLRPKDAPAMIGLANLAAAAGKTGDAVRWLKQANDAAPLEPDAAVRLAQLYADGKHWSDAIAVVEDLVLRFPTNVGFVELLAGMRADSGDTAGGARAFEDLVKRGGVSVAIYRRWAVFQMRAGNEAGARDALRRAMALAPDDEDVAADMIDIDYRTRGEDAAFATARSFESRQPAMSDRLAADVQVRAGHLGDAIELLRDGQAWRPTPRNRGRLAELLFQAGKHDDAKAMLRPMLARTDDLTTRLALANMELIDRQYDEAQAEYEKALGQDPRSVPALNNLASLYVRRHDPRARELALLAYRLGPGPGTADTLGWVLLDGGDKALALPYLEQAAAGLPNLPEVQYHLGVALQATGALARARTVLEQAVASKDDFTGKDDAERRLQELPRG